VTEAASKNKHYLQKKKIQLSPIAWISELLVVSIDT
jgi:hypothetical protein